jgi:2-phosphoglycerate kinase
MGSEDEERGWTLLVIGGGAAVGKTTAAAAIAARYGASVLPVDAIWLALKAVTKPKSHPQLHYFDPSAEELALAPEALCERHIASAREISRAMDPVIEYLLWEGRPVVLEGAWITPSAARRWIQQSEALQAVFIHEPEEYGVLATMLERKGSQDPTPFTKANSRVCWLSGSQGLLALRKLGAGTGPGRRTPGGTRRTTLHAG